MTEELKIKITAITSSARNEVKKIKDEVNSFKDQVKKASQDVDKHYKAIGDSIKNGLSSAVKAGTTALAGATAAIVALSPATEEFRINQAKLTAAFDQAGFSANSAKGVYKELFATIGESDQATESAANIAMLAESEKEAAQWAELASGVLGTFHDTLQPEAFYEAANETLKLGEATGAFTQMLEQTGVMSVEKFNEKLASCSTAQEKQAFMLEVSKNAMGEAGKSYDEATANIQKNREEQVKLQENLAKVGEAITPVITAFTSFANDALAVVTPYITDLAEKYGPQLKTVLEEVGNAVSIAFGYVTENWELLASIAGVIAGITAAITLYNIVQGIKTAMAVAEVTTVWGLVAAYAAQAVAMIAAIAPYVLIVAAIAAVIAIIVLCVKHWDEIKAKVKEVWENMQAKISEIVEKIKQKIEDFKNGVSEKFENIKTTMKNKINDAKNAVVNKFEEIKSGIKNKINDAKNAVSDTFNNIKNSISEKIEGAKNKVKSVIDTIKGFFNFKVSWPNIPTPKFSISPKGWSAGDLLKGKIPKLSIKWNALGGVFTKPTLTTYGASIQGLGEDGAEAIVPLEKNTQWLDKIADRLASRQSNTPIVLNVDGKTFAKTTINSVNALTKQTGSLGLKLY